jgi:hypothetical protein
MRMHRQNCTRDGPWEREPAANPPLWTMLSAFRRIFTQNPRKRMLVLPIRALIRALASIQVWNLLFPWAVLLANKHVPWLGRLRVVRQSMNRMVKRTMVKRTMQHKHGGIDGMETSLWIRVVTMTTMLAMADPFENPLDM